MGTRAYPTPGAGEWVGPKRKYYYMACCDCCLVHKIEFALMKWPNGKRIIMRVWRDNKRTGQLRRRRKVKVKFK